MACGIDKSCNIRQYWHIPGRAGPSPGGPGQLARSSYPPYHHKCFHIRLNISMLSYVSTSKTYNVQCLSRS